MHQLHVIVASTRPGRVGSSVGRWFSELARAHGRFEVDLIELADVDLPMLDEPAHPRLRRYENPHTLAWSAMVDRADAFVFVTPEYNYGAAAPLVNALDYLHQEWAYKPAAFVSYGGVSGGSRGVVMAKTLLTALKIMPIPETVAIPYVHKRVEHGRFQSDASFDKAAERVLDELGKWTGALAPLRASA